MVPILSPHNRESSMANRVTGSALSIVALNSSSLTVTVRHWLDLTLGTNAMHSGDACNARKHQRSAP
jgi:hypothetical protein